MQEVRLDESVLRISEFQVLTIAVTEPLSLLHSVPQKLTRAAEKKVLPGSSSQHAASPAPDDAARNGDAAPGPPAAAPSSSTSTDPGVREEPEKFSVDFEKIYKYLSMLSRDIKVPELSPYGELGSKKLHVCDLQGGNQLAVIAVTPP